MGEKYEFRAENNQFSRPTQWRSNDNSLYSGLIGVLRSEKIEDILSGKNQVCEKKARIRGNMERQTKIKLFLENICSEQDKQQLLSLNGLLQISKEKKDHEYLGISYVLFDFFENFKSYNENHLKYRENKTDELKQILMQKSYELKKTLLKFRKKFSVLKDIDSKKLSQIDLKNYQTEVYTLEQISSLFNTFLSVSGIDITNSITGILGEVAFEESINDINSKQMYVCHLDEETRLDLDSYKGVDFIVYYKGAYFLIDTKAKISPPEDCEYIDSNIAYRTKKFKDAKEILKTLESEVIKSQNSLGSKNLKKPNIEIVEIYLNTEHLGIQKTQDQYLQNLPYYIQQILEACKYSGLVPKI